MIPLRLNNFIVFTISIGLSITPTQLPFTNILVISVKMLGTHSVNNFNGVFALNHLIKGYAEKPFVIDVLIAMCLCNPTFPPSGVSTGSIYPHWEPCNKCGATTLDVGSIGKLIFLKCEINVNQDKRLRSWTSPTRFVFSSAPQFPLNPFLKPSSIMRILKKSL